MVWPPVQLVETKSVSLAPFVRYLFDMSPRIRMYPMFGDVEDKKSLLITKEHIAITYDLPQVEHEIAHLVEMKSPRRWTMTDLGMSMHRDDIKAGPFFAGMAREVRARAIQIHMSKPLNEQDAKVSTLHNILNNSYWREMSQKLVPFGRFKSLKDVEDWVLMLRASTFSKWNLDRITHEWQVRINHIHNWMES